MMFKDIFSFWKGEDFIVQVLEAFKAMLDDSESMFQSVCARLLDNKDEPDLKKRIYEIDKKVNVTRLKGFEEITETDFREKENAKVNLIKQRANIKIPFENIKQAITKNFNQIKENIEELEKAEKIVK